MFVKGGYVYPGYYLSSAGDGGFYWSSVGRNSFYAYNLFFYSGEVNPSYNNDRYYGQSVRCVALSG